MKYNDGDMDDLFRRASEGYPLRTDSADWDRLAMELDGEAAKPSDENERRRGIFWWFLLIPLAGIGLLTWEAVGHHSASKAVTVARAGGDQGAVGANPAVRSNPAAAGNAGKAGTPASTDIQNIARNGEGGGEVSRGGKVRILRTRNSEAGTGGSKDDGTEIGRSNDGGSTVSGSDIVAAGTIAAGTTAAGTIGAGSDARQDGDLDPKLALLDLRRAPIGGSYQVDVEVVAPKKAKDATPPPTPKRQSHGYIGVFGAPDFSTVRFQTMKGVGTTFGVLFGYSFNARWAVESGVSLDRKSYYTSGEYFSTEKVRMPYGYDKLLNVDGTCNMLEIPLNVRYNFSTSPRMKWFATAGLSTYLMSRENYTYQYEANWAVEDSSWNIHRPSQYWVSIVNLSAGFEQRLGRIGNLRLEPYIRIPLSGIGTGNLPIMSVGLNVGLTHQLW